MRILVVDDDLHLREYLSETLSALGFFTTCAQDATSALECLSKEEYDLVLSDLRMPGLNGLEFLKVVKKEWPWVEVVVITGYGTVESAVEAIKMGAYYYIQKPIQLELLLSLIQKINDQKSLSTLLRLQRETLSKFRQRYGEIIGGSPKMQEVYTAIESVKGREIPILISGESGTGKELVARTIWMESPRADKAFIPLNCGTIVPTIAESELFGHVKGAFTGAVKDKKGLFEAAQGGTLFLDELTELPPNVQSKLLRAIEEKRIRRVGDFKEIPVDVRLIAATNQDPEAALRMGTLRKDLYYRLNVVPIRIPPLREREGDVELLLDYFLKKHGDERGIDALSEEALEALRRYHWPGNVRELEHLALRIVIFFQDKKVGVKHLPMLDMGLSISSENSIQEEIYTLKKTEVELIKKALEKTSGNKREAAKLLGINPSTLYRKLKKLS